MEKWRYTKGLHEIGNGVFAYLLPNGSWGWSNAGLIVDGDCSLLVDTLFDLKQTRTMLVDMVGVGSAATDIDIVVNTHANGDHCWGNQLVAQARIIASQKCAEEMSRFKPVSMATMLKAATVLQAMGPLGKGLVRAGGLIGLKKLEALGDAAEYALEIFKGFDFKGIQLTLPKETFDQDLELTVGSKTVRLFEVGPAHTMGDTLVYAADDKTVFTGDILFNQGHPIMWAGPVSNWIRACNRILSLDVETVVPGHGPITDKEGVKQLKAYLEYLQREAGLRYEAGMTVEEAARDISFEDYQTWGDAERVVVNVRTLYREFSGDPSTPDVLELFSQMARMWKENQEEK